MFELETAADMSVADNRREAEYQLERCADEAALAAWARKYGRLLCRKEPYLARDVQIVGSDARANLGGV